MHAMRMHDHPALGTEHATRHPQTKQLLAVTAMICGRKKEQAKCIHPIDAKVLMDF